MSKATAFSTNTMMQRLHNIRWRPINTQHINERKV